MTTAANKAEQTEFNRRYKEAVIASMEAKRGAGGQKSPSVLLLEEKIVATRVKRQSDELILAKARDDLIDKDLVNKQASFLLIALRQRILELPQSKAKLILNVTDVRAAKRILQEITRDLSKEIRNLPQQVTDPHWLKHLDEEKSVDGSNG